MSRLQWQFALEPVVDGEVNTKKRYSYLVPDPKDDLDLEDAMTYVVNDFSAAIKRFKEEHPELLK